MPRCAAGGRREDSGHRVQPTDRQRFAGGLYAVTRMGQFHGISAGSTSDVRRLSRRRVDAVGASPAEPPIARSRKAPRRRACRVRGVRGVRGSFETAALQWSECRVHTGGPGTTAAVAMPVNVHFTPDTPDTNTLHGVRDPRYSDSQCAGAVRRGFLEEGRPRLPSSTSRDMYLAVCTPPPKSIGRCSSPWKTSPRRLGKRLGSPWQPYPS